MLDRFKGVAHTHSSQTPSSSSPKAWLVAVLYKDLSLLLQYTAVCQYLSSKDPSVKHYRYHILPAYRVAALICQTRKESPPPLKPTPIYINVADFFSCCWAYARRLPLATAAVYCINIYNNFHAWPLARKTLCQVLLCSVLELV